MSPTIGLHDLSPLWPSAPGGLFWIGLVLVGAAPCDESACAALKLSCIVDYAMTGSMAGVLDRPLADADVLEQIHILIEMILALALLELRHRLPSKWLRANHWLLLTGGLESLPTRDPVTQVLQLFSVVSSAMVTVSAITVAMSPAMLLQLKNESRARGQATERLFLLGVLNSVCASVLVSLITGWLCSEYGHWTAASIHPLHLLIGFVLLVQVVGKVGHVLYHHMASDNYYTFLVLVDLVLSVLAIAKLLKLSVPLTLLLVGVVFKYRSDHPCVRPSYFDSVDSILIVVMIVSLGLPLRASDWVTGGVAVVTLVLPCSVAKLAVTTALGSSTGLSMRQSTTLDPALGPMSELS